MPESPPPNSPPPSRVGQDFDAEAYLDTATHLVGITVAPEDRANVLANLRAIAAVAATLMEEELSDTLEAAPVFHA